MIPPWQFQLSTRIVHGDSVASEIGEIARGLGIRRAMVVTDRGVLGSGVVDRILGPLREAEIWASVFDGVEANPTLDTVDAARGRFAELGCDGVVAVGGGSALDAGKAIGVLATNPGPIGDYLGPGKVRKPGVPVIAVPTTAGTGAEVTDAAGLRDARRGVKVGIRSPLVPPTVAVLDPRLTVSLPPGPTRDTGMDALTHAVESCLNVRAWDGTRVLALRAVRLVGRHLQTAVDDGQDLEARDGMLTASLLAGVAFLNTDLGLVHAIALTLGGPYNAPHGTTNAILLPHVMRFLLPSAIADFADIVEALGEPVHGLPPRVCAQSALDAVVRLSRDTGLPAGLSVLGVREEDLAGLSEAAAVHPMAPLSPRRATPEDIVAILRAAL